MNSIDLQKELYKIYLKSPTNLFDEFINLCKDWYKIPAHSLQELRLRNNKKIKGDIFEEFSVLYLKYIKNFENVYLLKDTPEIILNYLGIGRRDMGIDIIAEDNNKYYAIQCKYKKHNNNKMNIVSWQTLSTFYALCLRSGPWEKYIIMTNCNFTNHQGKKNSKDLSICIGTFRNIDKNDWLKMCNINSVTLNPNNINIPNKEELRELRLKNYII